MKQSTACLLGYNQQYEGSAARSCSAGVQFGRKDNIVKAKSTIKICMPAVIHVQASQATPIHVGVYKQYTQQFSCKSLALPSAFTPELSCVLWVNTYRDGYAEHTKLRLSQLFEHGDIY